MLAAILALAVIGIAYYVYNLESTLMTSNESSLKALASVQSKIVSLSGNVSTLEASLKDVAGSSEVITYLGKLKGDISDLKTSWVNDMNTTKNEWSKNMNDMSATWSKDAGAMATDWSKNMNDMSDNWSKNIESIGKDLSGVVDSISTLRDSIDKSLQERDLIVSEIGKRLVDAELSGSASADDITKLKATVAVITSLSEDSASFKKFMIQSSKGSEDANTRIVSLAKDVADKVSKADFDSLKTAMYGKANASDLAKLASTIAAIDTRFMSKEEVLKILETKALQVDVENSIAGVKNIVSGLDSNFKKSIEELAESLSGMSDLVTKNADMSKADLTLAKAELSTAIQKISDALVDYSSKKTTDDILARVATAEQKVSSQDDRLNAAEQKTNGLDVADTTKRLSDAEKGLLALGGRMTSAEQSVTSAVTQLATINAGLKDKADVTVTNKLTTDLATALSSLSSMKTSIETITKTMGAIKPVLKYTPDPQTSFSAGSANITLPMVIKSGLVSIEYPSWASSYKKTTVGLETFNILLKYFDMPFDIGQATVSYRSNKSLSGDYNMYFGTAESYVLGLMRPSSIDNNNTRVQSTKFKPGNLDANTTYNVTLDKSGADVVGWKRFHQRLLHRGINSMIQVSSRYDCTIEVVATFFNNQNLFLPNDRPLDESSVEWKVYRDQTTGGGNRHQPRIIPNAVIDASNGLLIPEPDYLSFGDSGVVSNSSSRSICPRNTYVCGIENTGTGYSLSTLCCRLNPGSNYWGMYGEGGTHGFTF